MNRLIKVVETITDGQTTDNEKNKKQFYGTFNTCIIHPQCQNEIIACLELPLASLKYPPHKSILLVFIRRFLFFKFKNVKKIPSPPLLGLENPRWQFQPNIF